MWHDPSVCFAISFENRDKWQSVLQFHSRTVTSVWLDRATCLGKAKVALEGAIKAFKAALEQPTNQSELTEKLNGRPLSVN
jgi:hypothetical protein